MTFRFKTAFWLLPLLLFMGCPSPGHFDEETDISPQRPPCPYGFDFVAANGGCDCPEDKINIADSECVTLQEGEYYSTMDNCLIDVGMIIKIDSSRARFVENWGMSYDLKLLSLQPFNSDRIYNVRQLYAIVQEGEVDSIRFDASQDGYRLGSAQGYEEGNFRTTVFTGRMVHPDTIVGQFLFANPEAPLQDPNATACPAIFARAPQR